MPFEDGARLRIDERMFAATPYSSVHWSDSSPPQHFDDGARLRIDERMFAATPYSSVRWSAGASMPFEDGPD